MYTTNSFVLRPATPTYDIPDYILHTRAANSLALLVEAAHRGAHALGRDQHDVDVVAELLAA